MAIRWGIAGSGLICNDFVAALKYLGPEQHQVVAIASRNLKDAQEFAKKWDIQSFYEGYQKLAKDSNVDIVYIGTINTTHHEIATFLLNNGKHILCEKSMCLSSADTKDLVQLARKNKLFLMEAIWSRCFPVYRKVKEMITDGTLGKVVHVNVTFGKSISHVPRVTQKDLGGGAAYDIGIYTIQLALFAFGGKKPNQIKAVGDITKDGVDLCGAVVLGYEDGGIACLNYTVKAELNNNASVSGTKGTVEMKEPFWCSETLILPDKTEFHSKLPKFNKPVNFGNSEGLIYEATEVRRCLLEGLTESPIVPLEESIILAEIIEEIKKQIGAF